jgi:hypothetical protein
MPPIKPDGDEPPVCEAQAGGFVFAVHSRFFAVHSREFVRRTIDGLHKLKTVDSEPEPQVSAI